MSFMSKLLQNVAIRRKLDVKSNVGDRRVVYYHHKLGVIKPFLEKYLKFIILAAAGIFVLMQLSVLLHSTSASSHLLDGFTQTELDTNWEADRRFPTSGVTSVSASGRSNVAQLGLNSGSTATAGFERTEGIKTVGDQNFGNKVEVDLYLDPAWEDTAVRAGLWVVGDKDDGSTGTGARDGKFGIIEFINTSECDSCTSHLDNAPDLDFAGFRIWDSATGWTNYLATPFTYGEWVTLGITLDASAGQYTYSINGVNVGTASAGNHFIRETFLNSYNYGLDVFSNLNSNSYTAHWHAGLIEPELNAENFNTHSGTDYKGISVGFNASNFGTVTSVEVEIERADGSKVTKTGNSGVFDIINGATTPQQLSAPFVIQEGTFTEASDVSYWNPAPAVWNAATTPVKATIRVTDENGTKTAVNTIFNQGDPSWPTYESLLPANMAPVVIFADPTPAEGSSVNGTITPRVLATDDYGMGSYYIRLWKGAFESGAANLVSNNCWSAPGAYLLGTAQDVTCPSIDTSTLDDGTYVLSAQFQDGHIVWGQALRTFTIDNTAPNISWQLQPKAIYGNGDDFHVRPITSEVGTVKSIYFNTTDSSNLIRTEDSDQKNFDTKNTHNQALWDSLPEGTHKFIAVFEDYAGNTTTSESNSFIIDRTGPTITVKPESVGNTTTKVFSSVSFALFDAHQVDKLTLNDVDKDLTNNNYSDLNGVGVNWWFGEVEGLNTLVVYDVAGNSTTYEFILDTIAPDMPVHEYPADNAVINTNNFNFDWTDVDGAVEYEFQNSTSPTTGGPNNALVSVNFNNKNNGTGSQTYLSTSQIHSFGAPDGTVRYWQVRARDAAGNWSNWTDPWKMTIDLTAPTVPEITRPTEGQYFNTAPILNQWAASTDVNGISKYQIAYNYDDGHSFGSSTCPGLTIPGFTGFIGCRDVSGTSRNHAPSLSEQGGVTIWVRAIDNAGNVSALSDPVHYFYDATAPDAPTGLGWTDSDSVGIPHTGHTNLFNGVASWSASSSSDVSHYIYKYWNDIPSSPYNDEASAWVAGGIGGTSLPGVFNQGEGVHYFCVVAVDHADNQSPCSTPFAITYDITAPVVEIGEIMSGDTEIAGIVDSDAVIVELSFNGGPWLPAIYTPGETTWLFDITELDEDDYTVLARATDAAGNITNPPAEEEFAVSSGGGVVAGVCDLDGDGVNDEFCDESTTGQIDESTGEGEQVLGDSTDLASTGNQIIGAVLGSVAIVALALGIALRRKITTTSTK